MHKMLVHESRNLRLRLRLHTLSSYLEMSVCNPEGATGERGVMEGEAYVYSDVVVGRAREEEVHTAKVETSARHPVPSHVPVPVHDHDHEHRTQRVE